MQKDNRLNRILAFLTFLISAITYFKTVAPTTSFWDCGEFITSAYTLGIPHPPGAPLFLLVGRIFSMIPFAADIGLRVNVISSLASGLTVMLTYLIIVRLIVMYRGKIQNINDQIIVYGGSFIGALTLAFTESFWFNSVEAEVYAISIFFTAFVIWLILVWYEKAEERSSDKYILLIAYSIGLVIGVHLLSILALPVIFLIIYFRKTKKLNINNFLIFTGLAGLVFVAIYPGIVKWIPNLALTLQKSAGPGFTGIFFIALLVLLLLGIRSAVTKKKRIMFLVLSSLLVILAAVSTYSAIYIRSNLNPQLDENDPESLENMVKYLNREQYGDWSYVDRRAPLWEYQIKKMYLRYFGWQFIGQGQTLGADGRIIETLSPRGLYMIPFLIGLFGMFFHFKKDWKNASAIMLLFFMTGIAIVLYLNQEDPQPRERDYVYVGSFLAFAVWIGIGASAILDSINERIKKFGKQSHPLILGASAVILLLVMPINMFAFNYHSHDRTDNYVAYDYSYNILQSCEPNAILFTNGDNDTFPLWFLQYVYGIRNDIRVVNLSLLNTHWYIKQLRDEEPRVPISINDSQIDRLQPMLWEEAKTVRLPVPKDAYMQDMTDAIEQKRLIQDVETAPEIVFDLKPTLYGRAIRVQDIMILNIIRSTQFRRPIYFALTVSTENQINMQKYLRMDGLVFKIVTYPGERISPHNLQENIMNKFQFRNLNRKDVYYNENIKGLLRNYQGSFFSLSQFYLKEKMYDKTTEVLDKLFTAMPDTVIPMRHELQFQFAYMYYTAQQKEKADAIITRIFKRNDISLDDRLKYASYYTQLFKESAKGIEAVQKMMDDNPEYANAVYWLANYYLRDKQYEKGLEIIDQWMTSNPTDNNAAALKSQLQRFIEKQKPDSVAVDTAKIDSSKN